VYKLKGNLIRSSNGICNIAIFFLARVHLLSLRAIGIPDKVQKLCIQEKVNRKQKEKNLFFYLLPFTFYLLTFPLSAVSRADDEFLQPDESMAQVTSVSQLKDVQPTDWAFQALQTLVERYSCIAGYPDGNFRGDRALNRYEFAAGLNSCLDRINELIATTTSDLVSREDLATLQKLQEEFVAELKTLRGKVDSLETRTDELAANQFSPTTKLSGITIVGVQGRSGNRADIAPRDGKKDTEDKGTNTSVISFSQLYLTTQFDPRSYLVTGILAANGSTEPRLSNDVILGYEYSTGNDLIITDLNYHWLVTDNLAVMAGTEGVNMTTAFRGPNRAESGATGPLSYFAQRNPILNMGFGRAGVAVDCQFAGNVC
jgi:Carbohydrate-selective porin, OprB family/S-layer homology domain